jgi:hypothetical protein
MRYTEYQLPFGVIKVTYGFRPKESYDQLSGSEYTLHGKWVFQPAPYFSPKCLVTHAVCIVQCKTQLARPTILPALSTRVALSKGHPVWKCIERVDVKEFRQLLDAGSFGVNDGTAFGMTVLHYVGKPGTQSFMMGS